MLEDGLETTFAHRSFQEYFVAKFIQSAPTAAKGRLIRRFSANAERDSVMQLLFEMDPYAVEKYYILPAIDRLRKEIKVRKQVGVTHLLRYLRLMFKKFELMDRGRPGANLAAYFKNNSDFHDLHFIRRIYNEEFSSDLSPAHVTLEETFRKEYGENSSIQCTSFRTSSPVLRALMDCPGWLGALDLQCVIDIGVRIRKRHQEAESSLDAILNPDG